ncbi:MAG: hypothetical protein O3B87_02010 [bacterium]|nr:hypothetical protein [bacterium]
MNTLQSPVPLSGNQSFAIIDDGNWRGIIAPAASVSRARLQMLIEDIEDTDPSFINDIHNEYKKAKKDNTLISSSEIESDINS